MHKPCTSFHLLPMFCKKHCRICSSLCSYFYSFTVFCPFFLPASFLSSFPRFSSLLLLSFPVLSLLNLLTPTLTLIFQKSSFDSVHPFLCMVGAPAIPSALCITDQHFGDLQLLGETFTGKALLSPSDPRVDVPNDPRDGGKRSCAGRSSVPAHWTM